MDRGSLGNKFIGSSAYSIGNILMYVFNVKYHQEYMIIGFVSFRNIAMPGSKGWELLRMYADHSGSS